MGVEVLPTSFFSQPEPQGGISSNVLRLLAAAGDQIHKDSEQNAIDTEARMKAPVMAKNYNEAYQRIASGDISGLQALAQAGAMSAGNPVLTKMHEDASTVGLHVLDGYQKQQQLAMSLANEREKAKIDNSDWYNKYDYQQAQLTHNLWQKEVEEGKAKHAAALGQAAVFQAATGRSFPVPDYVQPPEPPKAVRPTRGGSLPGELAPNQYVSRQQSDAIQSGGDLFPLPEGGAGTPAPNTTGPVPVAGTPATPVVSAPASTGTPSAQSALATPEAASVVASMVAGGALSGGPEAGFANALSLPRATDQPKGKHFDFGSAQVLLPDVKDADLNPPEISTKINGVDVKIPGKVSPQILAAEELKKRLSEMQGLDNKALDWFSRELATGGQPKVEPVIGKTEKGQQVYRMTASEKDGSIKPYTINGDKNVWVTEKFANSLEAATSAYMLADRPQVRLNPEAAKQKQAFNWDEVRGEFKGAALTQVDSLISRAKAGDYGDLTEEKNASKFLTDIKSIDKDGKKHLNTGGYTHVETPADVKAKHINDPEISSLTEELKTLKKDLDTGLTQQRRAQGLTIGDERPRKYMDFSQGKPTPQRDFDPAYFKGKLLDPVKIWPELHNKYVDRIDAVTKRLLELGIDPAKL